MPHPADFVYISFPQWGIQMIQRLAKRISEKYQAPRRTVIRRLTALLTALLLAVTPVMPVSAAHALPDAEFTNYPDTILFYSPSVTSDELYNNGVNYLLVPDNIRQRLISDGVRIYLIAYQDEVLSSSRVSDYGDSRIGVAALTTHPTFRKYVYTKTGKLAYVERVTNGMIEIQTNVSTDTVIDAHRLVHEIGHYVDTAAGASTATYFAISSGAQFQNYYKQFGSSIVAYSSYRAVPALYNAEECWADCFKLAYTDPDTLKAISPALYQFVISQVNALPAAEPAPKNNK